MNLPRKNEAKKKWLCVLIIYFTEKKVGLDIDAANPLALVEDRMKVEDGYHAVELFVWNLNCPDLS